MFLGGVLWLYNPIVFHYHLHLIFSFFIYLFIYLFFGLAYNENV